MENSTEYDLIIIGGGPAGLTAGIYAARSRLNAVLVEKAAPGGQVLVTDMIENYPGFPEGITGPDLVQKMTDQAQKFDLNMTTGEVVSVDFSKQTKIVNLSDRSITGQSVIVATGASPRRLGVNGEERFIGKGISTCATCDAPFFRDKVVAAVGGGDTAVQESIFLTRFVKKVYLIHRRDQLRASGILQERAFANEKIEFLWDTVVTGIDGLFGVEKLSIKNVKTDAVEELAVDGCFVWVGIEPNNAFLNDAVQLDADGFIITDGHMKTSQAGVFAAGDGRSTPVRQIATAVGDGAIAALSAEHYLESIEK
jgi:thioredoxin reductase (NADPH)